MTENTKELLRRISALGASDLFIVAGRPLSYRLNDQIIQDDSERLLPGDTREIIEDIYRLAEDRNIKTFEETGDDDFSFALPGISRFRVSAYKQRGSLAAVIRMITFTLPSPREMGIPDNIIGLSALNKGLVLVTGPAGSGKSTTLSCIIDHINHTQEKHIITLEDPLEYLHRHDKSIVSQREINTDTESYVTALRAALRQSPDVILLGEMRDFETMQVAMTAAETGTSGVLHPSHDRNRQHHRPYHRRISRQPAAPDHRAAVHGSAGRDLPAARALRPWKSDPRIRNHDHESCNPEYDPRRKGAADRRNPLFLRKQ